MVAQRKTIHMRSRVTREKENISSLRLRHKEEAYVKKLELGLSIFRNKIQLRVDRCQEVLKRLDEYSEQMKICFLQFMDMLESSRKLISDEKEENLHIIQLLNCYSDKTIVSSKTQTVAPMVYGVPLKKASISLKRLDPFQGQHVPTDIADSSPASAVGFARRPPRLCRRIKPLVVALQSSSTASESSSSSDEDYHAPSKLTLPRYRRCRKWNDVDNSVSSTTGQELHLKSASILLKRLDPRPYLPQTSLDPRPYLPQTGSSDSSKRNMSFRRSDIENNVFDALYRAAVEINAHKGDNENETESLSEGNGQNHVQHPPPDPMVVLERLSPSAQPGELDSHDQDLDEHSEHEHSQANCKLKKVCEANGKSKSKQKLHQQPADSTSNPKKRKSEDGTCNMSEKQSVNRINMGRGSVKEGNMVGKRRRSETSRKRKDGPMAVGPANKADEDPLEGPSWLYKDGVKKERLKKLRRIRQGYLTPLYYLAPTIYSSTDESGDEMTEIERKSTKLRKKKPRKRN